MDEDSRSVSKHRHLGCKGKRNCSSYNRKIDRHVSWSIESCGGSLTVQHCARLACNILSEGIRMCRWPYWSPVIFRNVNAGYQLNLVPVENPDPCKACSTRLKWITRCCGTYSLTRRSLIRNFVLFRITHLLVISFTPKRIVRSSIPTFLRILNSVVVCR